MDRKAAKELHVWNRRGDSNPQPPVYKAVWAVSALCRNLPE